MTLRTERPVRDTIVIEFGNKERHIGTWQGFKASHPRIEVTNVETLHEYKRRLKPLNDDTKRTT